MSAPHVVFNEGDLNFEEELLRNPHSLKSWLRYAAYKEDDAKAGAKAVNMVYERALKELPGSYKMWYKYLRLRRKQVSPKDCDFKAEVTVFVNSGEGPCHHRPAVRGGQQRLREGARLHAQDAQDMDGLSRYEKKGYS